MEIRQIYKQAQALGVCAMMRGDETTAELLKLFTTPQGLEFYQKTGFPTLEIVRQFRGAQAEAAGVYIDAGDITLHGARKVVLVGGTRARLTYDDLASERHEVVVIGGARADVIAESWAVVFTHDLGGTITKEVKDNAMIL